MATARLRDLRTLQASPNAGAWLSAIPKGTSERFSAPEYQALLGFRTGCQLYPDNASCCACGQPMDPWGDHALSCTPAGLYRRHNRVRDTLWRLTQKAGWQPELEKTVPGHPERRLDLRLNTASAHPVAIDVTVTHALRPSNTSAARGVATTSAAIAEAAKRVESEDLCKSVGWLFRPFGLETTGGLGPAADGLVRQLQRFLCMRTGTSALEVADHVQEALSVALAKGRGEMLVAACPPTTPMC